MSDQCRDIYTQTVEARRTRALIAAPRPAVPLPSRVYPPVLSHRDDLTAWLLRGPSYTQGEWEPLDRLMAERLGMPLEEVA